MAAQSSRPWKQQFIQPCPSEQYSVSSFSSCKTSVHAALNTLVHIFYVPLRQLSFNLGRKLNVVYFQSGLWHTLELHWTCWTDPYYSLMALWPWAYYLTFSTWGSDWVISQVTSSISSRAFVFSPVHITPCFPASTPLFTPFLKWVCLVSLWLCMWTLACSSKSLCPNPFPDFHFSKARNILLWASPKHLVPLLSLSNPSYSSMYVDTFLHDHKYPVGKISAHEPL